MFRSLFLGSLLTLSAIQAEQPVQLNYTKDVLSAIGQCNKAYFDASFKAFLETNPTPEEIKTLVHAAYANNIEMAQKTPQSIQRIPSIAWSIFWAWFWYNGVQSKGDVLFVLLSLYGTLRNTCYATDKIINLLREPYSIQQKQAVAYYIVRALENHAWYYQV
jgi:hypothetical protein